MKMQQFSYFPRICSYRNAARNLLCDLVGFFSIPTIFTVYFVLFPVDET